MDIDKLTPLTKVTTKIEDKLETKTKTNSKDRISLDKYYSEAFLNEYFKLATKELKKGN